MLGGLVSVDETDEPQINNAGEWQAGFAPCKPTYCLNVGNT
jgi:hypothetical protein